MFARAKSRIPLDHPAIQRAKAPFLHPRWGTLVQGVAGVLGLLLVLRVVYRNNPPASGIYVFGALIGLLYAMIGFGLILVYRATRIINFAQAEIGAVPAVFAVLLIKLHNWPYLFAFLVCLVVAAVSGALVEVGVVRRFYKAPRLILSVATIGVGIVFAAIQLLLPVAMGSEKLLDPSPPRNPLSNITATIGDTKFDANALTIIFAAALVMIGLSLFFKYTDIGLAVRASSENADRANLLGIPTKRVSTVVWIIAAVLSALGVFLRIPLIGLPIGVDIGPSVLIYALAVAVIAKMENFGTALAAGLCIGILEQTIYGFTRDPSVGAAVMLPILLGTMLLQKGNASRGKDTGISTWQQGSEFRPIPPELRNVPEVAWGKAIGGIAVVAIALGAPFVLSLGQQILAPVVLIYAMVGVSLVILTGWGGQISLGQWGFAGIGALVAGGLAAHMHWDFFITLIAAGLVGAVAAVLIGLPALRIQGLYLAVTTLAFAIAVQVYLLSRSYFGGWLPTLGPKQQIVRPLLYERYSIESPRAFYYLTLFFFVLCLASARSLRKSRAGRVIIAARDNERGAQSYGVSIARARLAAFAISGFWAALAGALFAYHQEAIDSAAFSVDRSLELLIIVVIGGLTSLPGAILAALWFGFLRYGPIHGPTAQLLTSGLGVLLLLLFLPGGLAQVYYSIRDAFLRWVAQRRGILVPSLVADALTDDGKSLVAPMPEEEAAILHAEETVEALDAIAHAGVAISCPECGAAVPIDEVAGHPHFEVVEA